MAGESLFVLEMQSASYAILAANEAEKAARIKLVDYRMIGAIGQLSLSGSEANVRHAVGPPKTHDWTPPRAKGNGAGWAEERETSDEGRWRREGE